MPMTLKSIRRHATALALSACLVAPYAALATPAQSAPAEDRAAKRLEATLKPSGDPNGAGEAKFRLNKARGKVCATVEWKRIQAPDAAHIHRLSDGGVVVDLTGSVTGGANCVTGVKRRVIGRILDRPKKYYFNVHNATYPAGAIQGRLHR